MMNQTLTLEVPSKTIADDPLLFFFFLENRSLTFHVNRLLEKRSTCIVKPFFSKKKKKKKKKNQNAVCCKCDRHFKC